MTAERRCVACRDTAARADLLRLVQAPTGLLVADVRARLPGRGAWVHPRASCVERLASRPELLARALRTDALATDHLPKLVREAVMRALTSGLSLARAAGAITIGNERLLGALSRDEIAVVVTAADASERTLASVAGAAKTAGVSCVEVPLSKESLGQLVGRDLLAAVGVSHGGSTALARLNLARWESLS